MANRAVITTADQARSRRSRKFSQPVYLPARAPLLSWCPARWPTPWGTGGADQASHRRRSGVAGPPWGWWFRQVGTRATGVGPRGADRPGVEGASVRSSAGGRRSAWEPFTSAGVWRVHGPEATTPASDGETRRRPPSRFRPFRVPVRAHFCRVDHTVVCI